ncbi:MAG: BrnT family toxin [Bryobacteraceae bacterium]
MESEVDTVRTIDVRLIVADEIKFDWDEANVNHIAHHNVSREEAEQVIASDFVDLEWLFINGEERFVVIGRTNRGRFLTLVFTHRGAKVRPITAWDSTADEEAEYWKGA